MIPAGQEVSRLRKAGLLAEARLEAARLYDIAPTNLYNQRMIAWVYLDSIKHETESMSEALPYLRQLLALHLDNSETVLWEQLYWQLAKILFRQTSAPSLVELDQFKVCWDNFPKQPGKAYSVLLKALLSQSSHWPNLPAWLDAWGWHNLQPEDFSTDRQPNGKVFPALAERAYIATAKAYLIHSAKDESLSHFLNRLDVVSEANPLMVYLLYYRVQLRLKVGQVADAITIFLPFARQKQRDFWVWDLMADLHPGDTDVQLACYAKALTCTSKPEFLVKIRQKFAGLLIKAEKWAEAKAEIEKIMQVRTAHQWRIPTEVSEWICTAHYEKAKAFKASVNYYTQIASPVEQLLYSQQPSVLGVIIGINEQKNTAQFMVNEQITGGFGYLSFNLKPAVGDCLIFIIEQRTAIDGTTFPKVLHAKPTLPTETPLLKTVAGPFKRMGTIGFIGNAFVEASLAAHLTENKQYQVQAVKSFNTKRQTWGWKVFRIES